MNSKERKFYKENLTEVLHATLNPYEPGVVRMHLIPAKYEPLKANPSVVILNGKDIIPINLAWTILLAIFMKEVNQYKGNEVMRKDLDRILSTFMDISEGKEPKEQKGQLSIGKYAKKMKAPHRIDLMISSMTKDGAWNCNQKCLHCYAAGQTYADKKELSTEEWKKIIDKCKESQIPQLTFTGGEPTRRDDLVELIDYIV